MFENVKILEFSDYIWNHHEKCIQISTNMPGIGLLIREIHVNMAYIWARKTNFRSVKPMPASKVLSKLCNRLWHFEQFENTKTRALSVKHNPNMSVDK